MRLFVFLFMLLLCSGCQSALDDMISLQLRKEAEQLNKRGPKEVSDGVRMDSVSTKGKSIKFSYTLVRIGKGDVDPASFYRKLKKELTDVADTLPAMQFYRKNKVKVSYAYYYKDGQPLSTIVIKPGSDGHQ
ncbi:hypothetical protein [Taibaiella helva]|uniref:hypothetical protein n=1 Tax=Taibaiella helva TaxID=2301235 RepID=UPI000E580E01|nr:hypothetical protein [Taibaiella helva]